MDLEKIEISKKKLESSGFHNSKTPYSYYIVIPIFSKPFTGRIANYPVDEELFWEKIKRSKTLTLSKKISLKK